MNNRFLSHGKSVDNGKWVEGYLIEQNDPEHHVYICMSGFKAEVDNRHQDILDCDLEEIIPETAGQYTGKELHGKKLFVGDIVEDYEDYDDKWGYPATSYARSVVIWDEENFCYAFNTDGYIQPFSDWDWENTTKIGNIYDNPELLEYNKSEPILKTTTSTLFQPVLKSDDEDFVNFELKEG